jgi:serine O-acetyltransferase
MKLRYLLYADYYRASGSYSPGGLVWSVIRRHYSGFNYLVALRVCRALDNKKGVFSRLLIWFTKNNLRRIQLKYSTEIPWEAEFGPGLLLPHPSGIVIHPRARAGKNCTILQGVTIGNNLYQDRDCVAVIGDNVTICAGARIIGAVKIGDNVTVGANAVVTRDVEPGCIVAGVPARVIARKSPVLINCDYLLLSDFEAWKEGKLSPPQ